MKKLIYTFILFTGMFMPVKSQTLSVQYLTEGVYGIDANRANWNNLLRTDANLPLLWGGSLQAAFIYIYKLKDYRVADDWLTFSNIEEDSNLSALAIAGYNQPIGNYSNLFVGVRNMNEDYFATPVTAYFTNSSCGIYPTLSLNFPIANYPVSSFALHYTFANEKWGMQATLYNGVGYNGWTKRNNPFIIRPRKDGVFGLLEFNLNREYGTYCSGVAIHNRLYRDDDILEQEESTQQNTDIETSLTSQEVCSKEVSTVWWIYGEQQLWRNNTSRLYAIAQYSHSFNKNTFCRDYGGAGLLWENQRKEALTHRLGVMAMAAKLNCEINKQELAFEVSYQLEYKNYLFNPALHFVRNCATIQPVVMLRLGFTFEILK